MVVNIPKCFIHIVTLLKAPHVTETVCLLQVAVSNCLSQLEAADFADMVCQLCHNVRFREGVRSGSVSCCVALLVQLSCKYISIRAEATESEGTLRPTNFTQQS